VIIYMFEQYAQVVGTPIQQQQQQFMTPQNPFGALHNYANHLHPIHQNANTTTTTTSSSTSLLPPSSAVSLADTSTPCGGGGVVFTPKQSLMETPLLYCNSVSTPMSGGGGGVSGGGGGYYPGSAAHGISGISSLNLTDSDNAKLSATTTAVMPTGLMPPPVR
jgi:hypothetical protein